MIVVVTLEIAEDGYVPRSDAAVVANALSQRSSRQCTVIMIIHEGIDCAVPTEDAIVYTLTHDWKYFTYNSNCW